MGSHVFNGCIDTFIYNKQTVSPRRYYNLQTGFFTKGISWFEGNLPPEPILNDKLENLLNNPSYKLTFDLEVIITGRQHYSNTFFVSNNTPITYTAIGGIDSWDVKAALGNDVTGNATYNYAHRFY